MRHLADLLKQQHNIILQGPPGTGKTFDALRLTAHIRGFAADAAVDRDHPDYARFHAEKNYSWDIVQFHPAYNYEDFVRGIQVRTDPDSHRVRYDTVHRVFSRMCDIAGHPSNSDKSFVLIIDEINRANLAAVLGELIYALEYRREPVRTPYAAGNDGCNLTVPINLYIIGTMNTADRSIGHIDYAVRRRFAFVPMLPRDDVFDLNPNETRAAAQTLFKKVQQLFRGGTLSHEFYADDVQPGHTYFLAKTCDELLRKFVYQVLPLLREYVKDGVLIQSAKITFGEGDNPPTIDLSKPVTPGDDCLNFLRREVACHGNQGHAHVAQVSASALPAAPNEAGPLPENAADTENHPDDQERPQAPEDTA